MARVENNSPVTARTVFDISSVTKTFTAAAIMALVEARAVSLDSSVRDYIRDAPEAWAPITVRHLLTHTAGFPETDVPTVNGAWLADYTTSQMLQHAFSLRLGGRPGVRFLYSDLSYFLLGAVIERASGVSYAEFLRRTLFEPLGMRDTRQLDQYEVVPGHAGTYFFRNGRLAHNRRYVQVELSSAYGLLSTAEDLERWEHALANGRVLSTPSREAMWSAGRIEGGASIEYGLGWVVYELNGKRAVAHAGGTGTYYLRLPDDNVAVIVLTNLAIRSLDNGRRVAGGSDPRTLAHTLAGCALETRCR